MSQELNEVPNEFPDSQGGNDELYVSVADTVSGIFQDNQAVAEVDAISKLLQDLKLFLNIPFNQNTWVTQLEAITRPEILSDILIETPIELRDALNHVRFGIHQLTKKHQKITAQYILLNQKSFKDVSKFIKECSVLASQPVDPLVEAIESQSHRTQSKVPPKPINNANMAAVVDATSTIRNMEIPEGLNADIYEALNLTFGLTNFRPAQYEIIVANMLGFDTFVQLAASSGKSLTYQLPGVISTGITIVFSPLRALLEDQVGKLNRIGIKAVAAPSSTVIISAESNIVNANPNETTEDEEVAVRPRVRSDSQVNAIQREEDEANKEFERLLNSCLNEAGSNSNVKFLYMTPEKFACSPKILELLNRLVEKGKVSRFIIDEAACILDFGHNFRSDYTRLQYLKINYPRIPISCISASVNETNRLAILDHLGMLNSNLKYFKSSGDRQNIQYNYIKKTPHSVDQQIENFLVSKKIEKETGIIFCIGRRKVEKIVGLMRAKKFSIKPYHSGLTKEEKTDTFNKWIRGKIKIICCSLNSFGLGIDNPLVVWTVHETIPTSIESFYQESGRAGRNLLQCYSLILYHTTDVNLIANMIRVSCQSNLTLFNYRFLNLLEMKKLCQEKVICVRSRILHHFNEIPNAMSIVTCPEGANQCWSCTTRTNESLYLADSTVLAQQLASALKRAKEETTGYNNWTEVQFIDYIRGKNNRKNDSRVPSRVESVFGLLKDESVEKLHYIIIQLILQGEISVDIDPNFKQYNAFDSIGIDVHFDKLMNNGMIIYTHEVQDELGESMLNLQVRELSQNSQSGPARKRRRNASPEPQPGPSRPFLTPPSSSTLMDTDYSYDYDSLD